MSKEKEQTISRREFMKLAALPLLPLAVPGVCRVLERSGQTPIKYNEPTKTDKQNYVDIFYAEASGIPINNQGIIESPESTTRWYNYTETKPDNESLGSLIAYLENLSKLNIKLSYSNKFDESPSIDFTIEPNGVKNHLLFIVPAEAPYSAWMPISNGTNEIYPEGKPPITVTFIRLKTDLQNIPPHFGNVNTALNQSLAVEMFNALCEVKTSNDIFSIIGQEIISNSFGTLFTLKQVGFPRGTSYPKVQKLLDQTNYHYYYNNKPLGILDSPALYETIPALELPILTKLED